MPDPTDRRAHILALTAKALPIIESIHDLNRRACGDLQLGISETEASQLRALLSRIRTHLALLAGPLCSAHGETIRSSRKLW
jgi:DNA-binding MarR family transcriptional regulator